jgi:beta-N-acetylhexosaminidase
MAILASCSGSRTPPRPVSSGPTRPAQTTPTTTGTTAAVPSTSACTNRSVVDSWTVARRAAQVLAVPLYGADPSVLDEMAAERVGGFLLLGPTPPPATLAGRLHRTWPGPAPFVMADEEGGGVQRLLPDVSSLPWPRQMAASMTPSQVQAAARALAGQMRALGVDMDLAPVVDLDAGAGPSATNPDGSRSFSAVPAVASRYAAAFAQGLQSGGVVAVAKHFPGLGGSSGNTDYGPAATRPIAQLEGSALQPFEAVIGAGVKAVMVANATVPGLTSAPASLSSAAVTGLLRSRLHFAGLVLTDSLSAGAIRAAGYTVPDAAVAALAAGDDMVLFGSTLTASDTAQLAPGPLLSEERSIVAALVAATGDGRLRADRLDAAVLDVLAAKGVDLCVGA